MSKFPEYAGMNYYDASKEAKRVCLHAAGDGNTLEAADRLQVLAAFMRRAHADTVGVKA